MKVKVSDLVAEFLAAKGIRHVFGIIGSGNAHLFDSITSRGFTEIVCVHHEQAAVMAMGTYYRTSGRLSACLATTGAGSTNTLTGIVSCWMDSIPGMIISGNENSKFTTDDNPLRIWGIQGYDSSGTVAKMTKYSSRVTSPASIMVELERAYTAALGARTGPTWIDIPMNVQSASLAREELQTESSQPARSVPGHTGTTPITDLQIAADETLKLLESSRRPVLWLGHGIRLAGGVDRILPLLDLFRSPALVSWAGIDMVDSDHPLVFGRAGVYGQRAANFVLQNSDLIIAIGTRLAIPQVGYELSELARAAKIITVDIDSAEAAKHGSRIALPVCADAKEYLDALIQRGPQHQLPDFKDWIAQCELYRKRFPVVGPEHTDRDGFINSYPFMERLNRHFKPDQIVTTDMGTALLSGHQVLKFKPGQRLMTSTGLGEMGYGLPAAIGASIATDRGEVMCLNCDGGMMMNLQELQTVAHYALPLKIIIFNNDGYLMIKHTQKALFQGRHSGTDRKSGVSCPDFSKLATAFGFPAYQIRTWEDADAVLPRVQAETGPTICEVFMHPEQPLVPKLSLSVQKDGSIVSPPIEDLSPLLSRAEMSENMIIGMHPKSSSLES